MAQGEFNGISDRVQIADTKIEDIKDAKDEAANAAAEATMYQANDVQSAAFTRSQVASQDAEAIYNDALAQKQMADGRYQDRS